MRPRRRNHGSGTVEVTAPLPDCPTFADWYETVHDRPPFPWQNRLAARVAHRGWPSLVGVPTGLGKTACVDIAVWSLAAQADRPATERTAPTRLWWVVNRRLLVDDTYSHTETLAHRLEDPDHPVLEAVAVRLLHVADPGGDHDGPPLEAVRLRGGGHDDTDVAARRLWRPTSPARPAVICSTIPMYGSRVLFRGYGTSRSMRPIDAALALHGQSRDHRRSPPSSPSTHTARRPGPAGHSNRSHCSRSETFPHRGRTHRDRRPRRRPFRP